MLQPSVHSGTTVPQSTTPTSRYDYHQGSGDTYIYTGTDQNLLYTDRHAIPKANRQTIRPDLENLDLPLEIINKADEIYCDMQAGTKRGNRRKQLIFFCVLTAYNQLGIAQDPVKLANICGIKPSDMSKALSMCSSVITNFETPLVRYVPKDFIEGYYEKLSKFLTFEDDALDDIYFMAEEIMAADKELMDEKPQTVAAAILVFYLNLQGYAIEKDKFKIIFGRSDMTINKVKNKVADAYNT